MKHSELVAHLRRELGVTEQEAKGCLDAVIGAVTTGLSRGEDVELRGFGRFSVSSTPERPGRNPATNEAVTIPAGIRIKFKPSATLKGQLAP